MPTVPLPLAFGAAATPDLFGGNILAPRAEMTGPGSYAEAVDALGVTTLRYPGGSLTESYFDLANPDANFAIDNETGARTDFMPISDIMGYSAQTGAPVSIVLPTRQELSPRYFDDNGDRQEDVAEDLLRDFVRDVVTGTYGDGNVVSFEIGNEYWGSGRMNAVEYGRVAAEMTRIIDSELQSLQAAFPEAADIEILVQMGTNFGDSSLDEAYDGMSDAEIIADVNATYGLNIAPNARVDWTDINNRIVIEQFDAAELDAVDGVIAHVYSRGEDLPHTRYFALDQIEDTWQAIDPELEIHVTEWNLRSGASNLTRGEDYGLYQAHEMLELVETFMAEGVDAAQVWPLIQNSASSLSMGSEFASATPPGEMFTMLAENLPGMTMLDFTPADARDGELEEGGLEVHGFADGADLLFYIYAPQGAGVVNSGVDISALVADVGTVEASVLGVAPGQNPGNTEATAEVEQLDGGDIYAGGLIDAVLGPGEIMQVRLIDVTPTARFAEVFDATGPDPALPEMLIPDAEILLELDLDLDSGGFVAAPPPTPPSGPPQPLELVQALEFSGESAMPVPATLAPTVADPFIFPTEDARPLSAGLDPFALTEQTDAYEAGPEPMPASTPQLATTFADPVEAAQELLSVLGFNAPQSQEGDPVSAAEPGPDYDEEEEQGDDEGFDDMGLIWALALMPVLAMAGGLG
ncbi:type I secretion protein [Antarctobacter jejuensis]|uniref:type I secretion protein n=1 Tax=Antarctobacter jejuensis TaxID=1439938 RepID=UPI003FD355AC